MDVTTRATRADPENFGQWASDSQTCNANESKQGPKMTEATHGGRRDGAGPKQKYHEATIQTAIRLPVSLAAQLRTEAERRGVSRSDVIVEMLRAGTDCTGTCIGSNR